MILAFTYIARQRTMVPTGLRNFLEAILLFVREDVARPVLGKDTDRFIHYLWTVFFFILFCNLLGMLPFDSVIYFITVGNVQTHVNGAATGNIWVTATLAIISFFMIQVNGIREQGLGNYIKNFIPHVPLALVPLMYVLEIVGALVKPFALAVRLFANISAGHAVIGALLGLIFMSKNYFVGGVTVAGCAAFSILELFVAFLQAYIFTFLTTLFIGSAMHPDH